MRQGRRVKNTHPASGWVKSLLSVERSSAGGAVKALALAGRAAVVAVYRVV